MFVKLSALGGAIVGSVVLLVAAGCVEEEAQVVPGTPQTTPAQVAGESPQPTVVEEPDVLNLRLGDTAKVGDAEVTANSFRMDAGGEFLKPDPGNVWIIVDVTVVNTGDDAYSLSSLLQTGARGADGREYDIAFGPDLMGSLDGSIPAGDMLRGEAGFEVPETASGLQFVFKQALGAQQARWNLR